MSDRDGRNVNEWSGRTWNERNVERGGAERNGTLWSTTGRQNVERDGVERNSPATVVAEGVAPSTDPQGPVGLLPRPFACVACGGVGTPPLNFLFPDYYCRQAARSSLTLLPGLQLNCSPKQNTIDKTLPTIGSNSNCTRFRVISPRVGLSPNQQKKGDKIIIN